ncbi:hypothetical protein ES705_49571 [subsurface metagenome]
MNIASNILEAIGNTPLVELRRVVPADHARVLVKLEGTNPTGSMKDRMAITLIERAESDGRLMPGGTVVEYSGGSTGTSLALVCAVKDYRLRIVTFDAPQELVYRSVVRYFRPESTSNVTTVYPGPNRLAIRIAATTLAPEEVPAKSAS